MQFDTSTEWDFDSPTKFEIPHADHAEEAHQGAIYTFQISGQLLVTASADKTIRRWNLSTGRLIQPPLTGHEASVLCIQFDDRPEQDVLISGGVSGAVIIWRLSTGDITKRLLLAHLESVLSLAFDDQYLVTGSKDKGIKLWNRHKIDHVEQLPEFLRWDETLQTACSSANGLDDYTMLTSFKSHVAAVNDIKIRGDTVISASGDRTINIWSLQTGEVAHKLSLHGKGVACIQYNGRFLLAGSSDNTASIYDVESQVEVGRLRGFANIIRGVHAISNDQLDFIRIITGSYDGTVCIWEKDLPDSNEWTTKAVLEYGVQPEPISDANPYIHTYKEGERVFEVQMEGNKVYCSGQGNAVVGWEFAAK